MAGATLKNCPQCKKTASETFRPFCSKRCADIDLGGWLSERYAVPTNEGLEDQSEEGSDIE